MLSKQFNLVLLQLPSGKVRFFSKYCWATVGQIGNLEFSNIVKGKAGVNRWLGKTPSVRGVVMNPCDHLHGGGCAKTGTGGVPRTPWGKIALGPKTRKPKKYSDKYLKGV